MFFFLVRFCWKLYFVFMLFRAGGGETTELETLGVHILGFMLDYFCHHLVVYLFAQPKRSIASPSTLLFSGLRFRIGSAYVPTIPVTIRRKEPATHPTPPHPTPPHPTPPLIYSKCRPTFRTVKIGYRQLPGPRQRHVRDAAFNQGRGGGHHPHRRRHVHHLR